MTGLILNIIGLEEVEDFALWFYIERDRAVSVRKKELVRVFTGGTVRYYALVDVAKIGRGNLICRVEMTDKEATWDRPVVISGFTGYVIPCMGQGQMITGDCVMGEPQEIRCGEYGVLFEKVGDIPKNDGTNIFYGAVEAPIGGLEEVTQEMLKQMQAEKVEEMTRVLHMKAGEKLVVAVPYDYSLKVYRDDGMGVPVEFSNSVMKANGEVQTMCDGVMYRVYGEFFLVDGNVKIYIR